MLLFLIKTKICVNMFKIETAVEKEVQVLVKRVFAAKILYYYPNILFRRLDDVYGRKTKLVTREVYV